jgi:hypothetical protein
MGANKLEAFEVMEISRADIHKADYNPRKISASAAKKLKAFLRKNGLWSPLVVNKQTMILVSGHQRLTAMDSIIKKPDYKITVSMVDVDEETEVKGNIFMNNQSAMGEFDFFKLGEIHEIFPDIDFEKDLAFDVAEIDFMFGVEEKEEAEEKAAEFTPDNFREAKAKIRESSREENAEGGSYNLSDTDYAVTFVFPNNREKADFMKRINKKPTEKLLKSTILYDIFNHVYNISVLEE